MAHDYFLMEMQVAIVGCDGDGTRDSECQLNYVIVIGDGAMANTDGSNIY